MTPQLHNWILEKIKDTGLDFNIEDDVAGFLGVVITPLDDVAIKLNQIRLIDIIITALAGSGRSFVQQNSN
jgi:hypothetical protein